MKHEYLYRCPNEECGKRFAIMHEMSKVGTDIPCPDCGTTLKRVFVPLAITWRHTNAGMEVYTNEKDATDQLYEMITIED